MLPRRPEIFAAGFAWVCALLPAVADAHELPKGIGLSWQEGASADAEPVVISNRGLVVREGESFRIRCNEAYGVSTAVVPFVQVAQDGSWIIGTPEMVARSSDHACTLTPTLEQKVAGTGLGGFAVQTSSPSSVLVSTLDPESLTEARSQLLWSDDDAVSWSRRYDNAEGELFSALLTAPSRPERVYATGFLIHLDRPADNLFARSDDGGETFTRRDPDSRLGLVGVDPSNPDVVFAFEATEGTDATVRLLRSTDAGDSFVVVPGMELTRLAAFAGSPDGSVLWVGADEGLFRSTDHGVTFSREQPDYSFVSCLAYRAGKLWMCASQYPGIDGVWTQDENAPAFTEFLTFDDVVKPMACSGDGADEVCAVPWLDWLIEVFPDGPPAADAGALDPDAGAKKKSKGCDIVPCARGSSSWPAGASASLMLLLCFGVRRRLRR